MTRLPNKFGIVKRNQRIGDTLSETFFAKGGDGEYLSYEGYTFYAEMKDILGNVVANPSVVVSSGVPPDETDSVPFGKVSIIASPADLPTKQGKYKIWCWRVSDADNTKVFAFILIEINLVK